MLRIRRMRRGTGVLVRTRWDEKKNKLGEFKIQKIEKTEGFRRGGGGKRGQTWITFSIRF